MENQNKGISNLKRVEGGYQLNVGSMHVNMEYSQNNKSFYECMLNILKQK